MQEHNRLERRPDEGMIAGVAAGLARRYDLDVTLIRLLFVGAAILSAGLAVGVYLVAALVMPREGETPGISSLQHNTQDLVGRGRELYGESRRTVERVRGASSKPADLRDVQAGAEPPDPFKM